jgi:hypothetical protein
MMRSPLSASACGEAIVDRDDLAVDQDRVGGLRRGSDRPCDDGKRQQSGAAEPDSHFPSSPHVSCHNGRPRYHPELTDPGLIPEP